MCSNKILGAVHKAAFIAIVLAMIYPTSVLGQTHSDALVQCYAKSATADEKRAWAVWTVSNLLRNPALAEFASPMSAEKKRDIARNVMRAFERLTLVSCRKEAIAAFKNEGESSLNRANQLFGTMSTNEYFREPAVLSGLEESLQFFDKPKWDALGREAGIVAPGPK